VPPEAPVAVEVSSVPLATPEIDFAERAAARPPEPERPFPARRRAIFFDVENTSRPQHIARVIDYLAVDRVDRRTDFVAVGNWRVIGHDTARLLSGHGAQLLHSAPSTGVKDWSDLRIAVTAGVWLGTARPGDILEVVSDDRAFDAVGDVATGLGIAFRRLSYRGLTGLPREQEPVSVGAEPPLRVELHGGRRRRGRRGGHGRREAPPIHAAPPAVAHHAVHHAAGEPHTAPHDELLGVARDLIRVAPSGAVTLDALANALKERGFSRPPGSPRLITRLRRIRELAVSRSGHITLVDAGTAGAGAPATVVTPEPAVTAAREEERPAPPAPRQVERSLEARRAEVEAAQGFGASARTDLAPIAEAAQVTEVPPDVGPRRRRSRRGGRRRRRGAPASG
jgi:hypothetical protein